MDCIFMNYLNFFLIDRWRQETSQWNWVVRMGPVDDVSNVVWAFGLGRTIRNFTAFKLNDLPILILKRTTI